MTLVYDAFSIQPRTILPKFADTYLPPSLGQNTALIVYGIFKLIQNAFKLKNEIKLHQLNQIYSNSNY